MLGRGRFEQRDQRTVAAREISVAGEKVPARRPAPFLSDTAGASGRICERAAILLAAGIGYLLGRVPVGSGDYGQWLMLSRFYLGQEVPGYREAWGVPPLLPALLAFAQRLLGDPVLALQLIKGSLAAALVLAFYLAGSVLFRYRPAGLLAAVFAVYVTDSTLELFTFGGLPQILALLLLLLSVAAFARASQKVGRGLGWWAVGSLGVALGALTHLGTGLVGAAATTGLAVVAAHLPPARPWRERVRRLLPLGAVLLAAAAYFLLLLVPANRQYVQNPALQNYRGPEVLWDLLGAYPGNVWLLGGGALALLAGGLMELLRAGPSGFLLTASWALPTWVALGVSLLSGTDTDYARFASLLMAPLAVGAGGAVALLGLGVSGRWRGSPGQRAEGLPVVMAVALALAVGPRTVDRHLALAGGYAVADLKALTFVARWLDERLPQGQAVLATPREGKWLEGLTGREALFSLPVHFSFRASERSRGMAAESLLRSVAAMSNEFLFVKLTEAKSGPDGWVAGEPWVAINHGGDYVDVGLFPSAETALYGALSPHRPIATLDALEPVSMRAVRSPDRITLRTVWTGQRDGGQILYLREVSLEEGSASLDLVDRVISDLPIAEMRIGFKTHPWRPPAAVETSAQGADLRFPPVGQAEPRLRLSAPGQGVHLEAAPDGLLIRALGTRQLHVRLSAAAPGPPIYFLDLFLPSELVDRFRVGAIVLKEAPDREARLRRLALLGFVPQIEHGPYVVLMREEADGATRPLGSGSPRRPGGAGSGSQPRPGGAGGAGPGPAARSPTSRPGLGLR